MSGSPVSGSLGGEIYHGNTYLATLGKQIKNDFSRDASTTEQRVIKLVDLLLDVHSPVSFELSVSRLQECYPCPPSSHSYSSDPTRVANTECINYIISQGQSMDSFKMELSAYDDSKVCGRVWKHNFVAYRCKTCALSPCMSLCNQCFHLADHKGHDYNMFRSQAGGACDCGDENVLLPSGFCSSHGYQKIPKELPDKLLSSARVVLPRLLLRLLAYLRNFYDKRGENGGGEGVDDKTGVEFNRVVAWLEELVLKGQAMRKSITQLMLSQQQYTSMLKRLEMLASSEPGKDRLFSPENFLKFQKSLGYDVVLKEGPPLKVIPPRNFIEEIFFWAVVYELPEPLTTFFLNLLPDQDFKTEFARVFLRHYPSMTYTLLRSGSGDGGGRGGVSRIDVMSNNIVHMSVQLFSNESLALEMVLCPQEDLLHVLLTCMNYMVQQLTIQSHLFEGEFHTAVDVSLEVVSKHCYWSIFSDFLNLMAHCSVVQHFFSRNKLMKKYSSVVECFTGMDGEKRAVFEHIEFENSSYLTAFSVEIEACASPLWALVYHLPQIKESQSVEFLRILHSDLIDTVTSCGINIDSSQLYLDDVSFHWPLHRTFIALLTRVVNKLTSAEFTRVKAEIGISSETIKQLLFAPLHLLCRVNEISCNVWVRNGTSIVQQSLTYLQPHFSHSLVDADILFVQFAASMMDPDYFLERLLCLQGLKFWFGVNSSRWSADEESNNCPQRVSPDSEPALVEGVLRLLCLVVNGRLSLGMDQEQYCREELMASLTVSDKPYSQLMDIVTEKISHNLPTDFKEMAETMMEVLAVFHPPGLGSDGVMRQGIYQLTLQSWLLNFDPLHTSLRSIRKSEFQNAMQRYCKIMSSNGYCSPADNLWPPFKSLKPIGSNYEGLLRILHSKTLHAIIFIVLYKAVCSDQSLPESLISLAVHLLSLCLDYHSRNISQTSPSSGNPSTSEEKEGGLESVQDFRFSSWFPTNNIVKNCAVVIKEVTSHSKTSSISRKSQVNEDMLSLLVKLHNKLHRREGLHYRVQDIEEASLYHHNYNCGTAIHHIKLILARVLELGGARTRSRLISIVHALNPEAPGVDARSREATQSGSSGLAKKSPKSVFLERKNRARANNMALMKNIQQKQQRFLEANYASVMAAVKEDESGHDLGDVSCRTCVICNQSQSPAAKDDASQSIEDDVTKGDYLVLMAFAQLNNVLSKRRHNDNNMDLSKSSSLEEERTIEYFEPSVVSKLYEQRMETFFDLFPTAKGTLAPGFLDGCYSHTGSLSITNCDHVAHSSCINKYKATLRLSEDDEGELGPNFTMMRFNCPVCRKKCNFSLPLIESSPLSSPSKRRKSSSVAASKVGEHISPLVTTSFDRVMKFYVNKLRTACVLSEERSSDDICEDVIHQLAMILYSSLLFELVLSDNRLVSKSYTPQAEQIASFYNTLLNIRRYYNKSSVYGETETQPNQQNKNDNINNSSILFRDSFRELLSTLIQSDISNSNLERLIDDLVCDHLNEEITKQLFFWAFQLSEDERRAWINSASRNKHKLEGVKGNGGCTVRDVVPHILDSFIQLFPPEHLSSGSQTSSCHFLSSSECAISAVIWSEKSLESFLQNRTEQFLSLCVLLKSNLLLKPIDDQVCSLRTNGSNLGYFNIAQRNILDLPFPNASLVISKTFNPLLAKGSQCRNNFGKVKQLISWCSLPQSLTPPRLIDLPDDYDSLYGTYRNHRCVHCDTTPLNISVCLICSALICVQDRCCRRPYRPQSQSSARSAALDSEGGGRYWCEACSHAHSCGNGIGVVLMLATSQVLVLCNQFAAIWGCLHLDSHGEEDKELRRGKPLFLSRERYQMLNNQWLRLKFDSAHLKWFNHLNKL